MAHEHDARFEALVRVHQHRVFACALALMGRAADAEDAAQETFLRAYRALGGYDDARAAGLREAAWLHRICVNVCRNRARAAGSRPVLVAIEGGAAAASDSQAGPEAMALAGERRARILAALAELAPAQREAVVLRHVHGYPSAEAAVVLGVPEGTLKSNLFRGLAALRRRLAAEEVAV